MTDISKVINAMIGYYAGDIPRINHFLKVYGFAKAIGETENLDKVTMNILEIAALVHDIGIKVSEKKYQSTSGYYQQIEGPPEARKMLKEFNFEQRLIERVCWLIAHHHTYHNIEGIDHQILVEADFLVNLYAKETSLESIKEIRGRIFKTNTGKLFLDLMYK